MIGRRSPGSKRFDPVDGEDIGTVALRQSGRRDGEIIHPRDNLADAGAIVPRELLETVTRRSNDGLTYTAMSRRSKRQPAADDERDAGPRPGPRRQPAGRRCEVASRPSSSGTARRPASQASPSTDGPRLLPKNPTTADDRDDRVDQTASSGRGADGDRQGPEERHPGARGAARRRPDSRRRSRRAGPARRWPASATVRTAQTTTIATTSAAKRWTTRPIARPDGQA